MKTIEIIAGLIRKYAARAVCAAFYFLLSGFTGSLVGRSSADPVSITGVVIWMLIVIVASYLAVLAYAEYLLYRDSAAANSSACTSDDTENLIQQKGANVAPRVTPADIEANIAHEGYFVAADALRFAYIASDIDGDNREAKNSIRDGLKTRSYSGACIDIDANTFIPESTKLLTFCVLVLRNGFTVTGESACASPENFNVEIGRKIARENAIAKIRPLMGYELRSKLAADHGDQ